MAKFTLGGELDKFIKTVEGLAENEEMAKECIQTGQDIMLNEIQKGAQKHVETKRMYNSLGKSTPVYVNGVYVGRVKFYGTEGTYVTKTGKEYDITNSMKALRIEYGASNQKAQPFVKPAINRSKKQIIAKWQEIYDKELMKKL